MSRREVVSVSLPKDLSDEITSVAEKKGVSKSELVAEALMIYINQFVYPVGQEKKCTT